MDLLHVPMKDLADNCGVEVDNRGCRPINVRDCDVLERRVQTNGDPPIGDDIDANGLLPKVHALAKNLVPNFDLHVSVDVERRGDVCVSEDVLNAHLTVLVEVQGGTVEKSPNSHRMQCYDLTIARVFHTSVWIVGLDYSIVLLQSDGILRLFKRILQGLHQQRGDDDIVAPLLLQLVQETRVLDQASQGESTSQRATSAQGRSDDRARKERHVY
mmetsp:Transcript_19001/g.44669  ORF Transcript_19001/g.44669 Transcript_19001/m.44669 type:complete len:215 (-) Transcript_19001:40-684(-)